MIAVEEQVARSKDEGAVPTDASIYLAARVLEYSRPPLQIKVES